MMISTNNFRNGLKLDMGEEPFTIIEFQHVKPGKGGAFVRTKLKSLRTGRVLDKTFRAGEKLPQAEIDEKRAEFLYEEQGDKFYFMDTENYEELVLMAADVGEKKAYLADNIIVSILFYRGRPLGIELPIFVELEVVETEPGVRGDTASGATKPATLATGAVVQVPLFINKGDFIRMDTRLGNYMDRVK